MGFDLSSIFAGGVEGLFKGVRDVVGAFKADPTIALQANQKLAELEIEIKKAELAAEVQMTLAQTKINEIEASSSDKFASRWRPAVGWVCVIGFAYANLLYNVIGWISRNSGWKEPPPLDTSILETTLFALLGVAGLRSFDKFKGTTPRDSGSVVPR